MGIDDVLKPGERMVFSSNTYVEYGGRKYNLYLTDDRLLLHMGRGLIFKKDDVVSRSIKDIGDLDFKEEGLIKKKGIITFNTLRGGKLLIKTGAAEARAIYNALMENI